MKTLICADGNLEVKEFRWCPKASLECKVVGVREMQWIVEFSENEKGKEAMLDEMDPELLLPCLVASQELKFAELEEYLSGKLTNSLKQGQTAFLNFQHNFTADEVTVLDSSYVWLEEN